MLDGKSVNRVRFADEQKQDSKADKADEAKKKRLGILSLWSLVFRNKETQSQFIRFVRK